MIAITHSATSNRGPSTRRLAGVIVAGAALATMLFGGVGVAVAQDCPLTDPTCVIDTVDDTVGDVGKTVEDTTSTAKDEVATTTDKVTSTLDESTGPSSQLPGEGHGDGSGGQNGGGTKHHGGGSAGGSVPRSGSPAGPSVGVGQGVPASLLGTATVERSIPDSTDPSGSPDVATRLREAATGIALSLVVVLAAVLLFTAVQVRLDRREPKLALAPVTSDVLIFE